MSNAIERVEEQGGALTDIGGITWTRELLDLAKKSLCPAGITDTEFELFVMQCRTRGLNPFAGEAYCVARRTNTGTKDNPKWVTNHVLQTSVEGMRARAVRHGDLEEFQGAAIFDKDTCVIDMDAGTVQHKYDAAKQRGVFVGAWAKVKRRGMKPVIIHLLPGARRPDGPVYANNPSEHLMKCAKSAALRDAYPVAFSGVYAREEMPEESADPSKAEQVLGATGGEAPASEPKALPVAGATVAFGGWKNRPIAALTGAEAKDAVCFANAKIAESPKAKWVRTMQENRDAIAKHHDIPGDLVDAGTADAQPVSGEPSEAEKEAILAQERALTEPGSDG
jgi:phage recombination protein Bet